MASACLSSMATTTTPSARGLDGHISRGSCNCNSGSSSSSSTKWLWPRLVHSVTVDHLAFLRASSSSASSSSNLLLPSSSSRRIRRACATSLREDQELEVSSDQDQSEDELSDGGGPAYAPDTNTKLYVGNLPWSCNSEELADVFQKVGSVEVVEVIYDRMSGRSRGFGFVTMTTVEDANTAIEKLDGADYAGRTLKVNFPLSNRGDPPPLSRPRSDVTSSNKLFVGNLAWGMDNARLEEIFGECGQVVEARIVLDRETGRSRGFGFVTMASEAEANEAVNKMDGADVEGRNLRVNLAGERPPARGDFL